MKLNKYYNLLTNVCILFVCYFTFCESKLSQGSNLNQRQYVQNNDGKRYVELFFKNKMRCSDLFDSLNSRSKKSSDSLTIDLPNIQTSQSFKPTKPIKLSKITNPQKLELQRFLVTKYGSLDVLGDIYQYPNGAIDTGNFGQNIHNVRHGQIKYYEKQMALDKIKDMILECLIEQIKRIFKIKSNK